MTPPKDAAASKDTASKEAVVHEDTAVPQGTAPRGAASKDSASAPAAARPGPAAVPPGSSPAEKTSRIVLLLFAAAAGAAVGGIGSFGHRTTDTWLGVGWPVGLALCFGGLIGLLLGLGELLAAGAPDSWRPTRLSALSCASAGWLLALLWLTYFGPPPSFARKGDVILANDGKSLFFLLGGMLVITFAVYRAWVASLSARLASRPGASGNGHSKG